jgi:hypothetical protein
MTCHMCATNRRPCRYGAYGNKLDPSFNPAELALLDRGYGIAIAHVRGGGELGWRWHADGRRLQKKNTFLDLIACVDFLVEHKYCSKTSVVGWGRSAGEDAAAVNGRPVHHMDVFFTSPCPAHALARNDQSWPSRVVAPMWPVAVTGVLICPGACSCRPISHAVAAAQGGWLWAPP